MPACPTRPSSPLPRRTAGRVLTLNRKHFIRLHQTVGVHAGIVVCTFDADHVGQAGRITAAVMGLPSLAGQLTRVNRTG